MWRVPVVSASIYGAEVQTKPSALRKRGNKFISQTKRSRYFPGFTEMNCKYNDKTLKATKNSHLVRQVDPAILGRVRSGITGLYTDNACMQKTNVVAINSQMFLNSYHYIDKIR